MRNVNNLHCMIGLGNANYVILITFMTLLIYTVSTLLI